MLGNTPGTGTSERRPSAELLLIQRRMAEIDIATRSEHYAELRRFPDLFAAKEEVPTVSEPVATAVPSAVAANVITMANQQVERTLSAQEQRVAESRALIVEAYGDQQVVRPSLGDSYALTA